MTDLIRKPIEGYPGYEVDNMGYIYVPQFTITVNDNGRIYNRTFKARKTKGAKSSSGYYKVTLRNGEKKRTEYVHRIVAKAFIPNPDNLNEINHKDENGRNNRADNLEWCTHLYNVRYGTAIERRAAQTRGRKYSPERCAEMSRRGKERYKDRKPEFYEVTIKKRKPVMARELNSTEWTWYPSMCHAGKAYGIDSSSVRYVCNGRFKQCHGYVFKYANPEDMPRPINYEEEENVG